MFPYRDNSMSQWSPSRLFPALWAPMPKGRHDLL
jgi:hypothetical protein